MGTEKNENDEPIEEKTPEQENNNINNKETNETETDTNIETETDGNTETETDGNTETETDTNTETETDTNTETEKYMEIDEQKQTQNGQKIIEPKKDEMAHYVQSLMNSGLSLHSNALKEEMLLPDSKTVARFSPLWKQSLASVAAICLTFTSGLTSGYSAVLLPQLQASDSSIPTDESTASWIASMAALPMAPGCLISGWMMEKFGRRNAHYMVSAPLLLGWILIASANNLAVMLLGRFFTGLCVGLLGPLTPVFISEITDPKYRGIYLAAISLAIAVGIMVSHLIGTWVHWQWTALICCIFPVISVILFTMVPESPTWLISKGEIEDGVKAFGSLRGYGEEAKAELKAILEKKKVEDSKPVMTLKQKLDSLKSPELLKPLGIMIIFFITCQLSGVNAIAFYSIKIIEKSVGKGIDHYLAMLVIDLVRTIMSVVACVVCKKYGRRPLCMVSGMFTALSMVGLAVFLHFTEGKETNLTWIPLTCLLTYICAISIGLVPLPWMMCGELFPTKMRGLGSGISSATTFVAFFAVVKTFPGMMTSLGEVITFLTYGLIALIGTGVLYFILPETKGKSLQEIEDKFKKPKQSIA